jgi:hypothetical protein
VEVKCRSQFVLLTDFSTTILLRFGLRTANPRKATDKLPSRPNILHMIAKKCKLGTELERI